MKKIFKTLLLLITLILVLGGCSLNTPIKTEQTSSKQEIKENVTIPQKEISPEEKEFNESGRAKAIEKETDLWQIYDSPELGFSFNYPMHVKLLKDNEYNEDTGETYIKIRSKDIGTKEWPTDLSLEDEKKNIKTLHRGEFGINRGFSLENSEKVKTVGFLFAQDFMTLARFEVCNVTLERSLIFYFNNKEITITLYGPIDTLKETMSEYFTINEEKFQGRDKLKAYLIDNSLVEGLTKRIIEAYDVGKVKIEKKEDKNESTKVSKKRNK